MNDLLLLLNEIFQQYLDIHTYALQYDFQILDSRK